MPPTEISLRSSLRGPGFGSRRLKSDVTVDLEARNQLAEFRRHLRQSL